MRLSELNYKSYINYKKKQIDTDLIKAGLKTESGYTKLGEHLFNVFENNIDLRDLNTIKIGNREYVYSKYGNRDIVKCLSCECKFDSNDQMDIKRDIEKDGQKKMELLLTEGATSVNKLLNFVDVEPFKIVKTMIYNTDDGFAAILVLGDRNVNLEKVKTFLNTSKLELASISDVEKLTNSKLGFAGPINLDVSLYADIELQCLTNFVVGANITDHHYINVNLENLNIKGFGDFKVINKNDLCPKCSNALTFEKTLLIKDNNKIYYDLLFSYAFSNNITNLVETHIIVLKNEFLDDAVNFYNELKKSSFTLLDDRDEKPNVKFNDSELLKPKKVLVIGNKFTEGLIEIREGSNKKLITTSEFKELVKGN